MAIDLAEYIARRNEAHELGYDWLLENGPPPDPYWTDPEVRKACAAAALTLSSSFHDDLIRRAFQEHDFNPLNLFDWRALLWFLVERNEKHRKPDPREKWNEFRLIELLGHFYTIKCDHPNEGDKQICAFIKRRFGEKYKDEKAETVRRQLSRAVKEFISPIEMRIRETHRRANLRHSKKRIRNEALALFCSNLNCAENS